MKHKKISLTVLLIFTQSLCATDDFKIIINPLWYDLEKNSINAEKFGGKWILAGNITFRKKAKELVNLDHLYLQWEGEKIDNLLGSLYQKNVDKKFAPLEANLVCDGIWNASQQTLKLNFDRKQSLGPVNVFCLVLTVPKSIEQTLRHGKFHIAHEALPEPFREATTKLSLNLDIIDVTTSAMPECVEAR